MYSIIFGTRPEYLKLKPLIELFEKENVLPFQVIYIKQHSNILDVSNNYTTITIEESHDRLNNLGVQILEKLPAKLIHSTYIVVQGDTATTFYSSLVAFQMKRKIIYLEAGLRTYNLLKPYPEEGYRQMISRISDYNFTPHDDCTKILLEEKVSGKIFNVGNTIIDLIKSYNFTVTKTNKVLITIHRRENWENIPIFIKELNDLATKFIDIQFLWFLHPNKDLQNIIKQTIHPTIILHQPLNHYEFTKEITSCYALITDSGGIQEEAAYFGKQTIVLRQSTERYHIGYPYVQTLHNIHELQTLFQRLKTQILPPCFVYGNGNASIQIYNILKSHVEDVNEFSSLNA